MHQAFVLAAGLGTRLRPLTDYRPKPLVPVCGVPMLAYSLAACREAGLVDVVVNAHWLSGQIEAWEGDREGVRVTVSTEQPDVLGTGGGLRKVRDRLSATFAVLNADVIADIDLRALRRAVPAGGAAMALRSAGDAARYGIVAADATDTVVRLTTVARAAAEGDVREDTHFTGLHAMDVRALDLVPDGFQCIIRTAYADLVPRRLVRGVRHDGAWLDIGDPALYLEANLALLHRRVHAPLDPLQRSVANLTVSGWTGDAPRVSASGAAWIGQGARFGRDVHLEDAIIGNGAIVGDRVRLTRCVVWDGCEVASGDYHDAVIFDGGVLQVGAEVG
jgi:mannose-1-phosphate guanylyltransferase